MKRSSMEYMEALRAFYEEARPMLTTRIERGIYSMLRAKYSIDLPLAIAKTLDWSLDFKDFSVQAVDAMKKYRRDLKRKQTVGEEPKLMENTFYFSPKYHIGQTVVLDIGSMQMGTITAVKSCVTSSSEGTKIESTLYKIGDELLFRTEGSLYSKEEAYDRCRDFMALWKGNLDKLAQ